MHRYQEPNSPRESHPSAHLREPQAEQIKQAILDVIKINGFKECCIRPLAKVLQAYGRMVVR